MQKICLLLFLPLLIACESLPLSSSAPTSKATKKDILTLQANLNEQLALQQKELNSQHSEFNHQLARQQQQFNKLNLALTQLTENLTGNSFLAATNLNTAHQASQVVTKSNKLVLGQAEYIGLVNEGLTLPARVDTGAKTSSLHATNIQNFERDGQPWLRFITHYQAEQEEQIKKLTIEAPLVRQVRIKQASGQEDRPVISLEVLLGGLSQTAEFTLTDRSNLQFPLLLGRSFFMDIALVDVSQNYLQGKPNFPKTTDKSQENADQ